VLSLKTAHLLSSVVDDLQPFAMVTWLGGTEEIAAEFATRATPYVANAANALSALGKLTRMQRLAPWSVPAVDLARESVDAGCTLETITEDVVEADLATSQIRVAQGVVAHDEPQACEVARGLGFPVVMKALSKDIAHRAKDGAVAVNIANEDQIRKAFSVISENVARTQPGATLAGVLIQKQYDRAIELIVGMHDDASFGPVCLLGIGGVAVENMCLGRFGLLPMTPDAAGDIVLASPAVIQLNQAQRENLASLMVQLSDWWEMKVADGVKLCQVDLNPVLFESDAPLIADALAVVEFGTWH
jgi:acyl-CoA synthetase (NDP forming)